MVISMYTCIEKGADIGMGMFLNTSKICKAGSSKDLWHFLAVSFLSLIKFMTVFKVPARLVWRTSSQLCTKLQNMIVP